MGDYVKKYGVRTDKTEGMISSIDTDAEHPALTDGIDTRRAARRQRAAWVGNSDGNGPKLLGLNMGHTVRSDGGYGYALVSRYAA
jgi:hypothetical protein